MLEMGKQLAGLAGSQANRCALTSSLGIEVLPRILTGALEEAVTHCHSRGGSTHEMLMTYGHCTFLKLGLSVRVIGQVGEQTTRPNLVINSLQDSGN